MLWQYAGLMLHELGYILRPRTTQLLLLRDKADIFYFIPLVERMWRCIRPGFTRVEQISKPWRERALTKFGEMEEVQLFYKQLLIDIVLIYFSLSYFNFNILRFFPALFLLPVPINSAFSNTIQQAHQEQMYANVDDVIVADDDEVVYVYYFFFFFFPRLHHSGNTTPEVLAASFHSRDQSLALPFPGTACPPPRSSTFCSFFAFFLVVGSVIQL